MKNFSQLIKENDENKSFKYTATATVTITGNVNATNEGDAGYMIDSDLEPGNTITGEIVNYEINSIDEVPTEFNENILNDDLNSDDKVVELSKDVLKMLDDKITSYNLTDYYKSMLLSIIRNYI